MALKDLSPAMRTVVRDVQVGKISDPVRMLNGVLVLMVVARWQRSIKMPERAIADRLMQKAVAHVAALSARHSPVAVIDIEMGRCRTIARSSSHG